MQIPHHLLGKSIPCECEREHFVPIAQLVVDKQMLPKLGRFLSDLGLKTVLVVADQMTYEVLGEQVHSLLQEAGFSSRMVVLRAEGELLPDRESILHVQSEIESYGAETVLAVGSGVINDIVRYATYEKRLPYIVIATAPSMDGYASSVAALQFNGVKTTLPAQVPMAIFADPRVLSSCPWELIQSGFGDLVGKVISLLDWKLSHFLYGEFFCPKAYELVLEPLKYCVENAERLRSRDEESVSRLFIGLINSGIAMALLGNSRPCSGSEHHCSHFWDLLAYQHQREHASHGLQVGYSTGWMMRFYQFLARMNEVSRPLIPELTDEWQENVRSFYREGAMEILSAQQEKQRWLIAHQPQFVPPTMTDILRVMQPELSMFPAVERALSVIGIPTTTPYLGITKEMLCETFSRAKELRARYTIFDFLEGQNMLEAAKNDVLASLIEQ